MLKFATNPFPGMNPWLESHWGDIHTRLTTYACDAIQRQLPGDLQARMEEYLAVDEPEEETRSYRRMIPDVRVIEQPGIQSASGGGTAVADFVAEEPFRVRRRSDPETLRYIKIVDSKSRHRIVTVIEFLSPANKVTAAGRKQYLAKQRQLISGEVSLVEIDLLREGTWVLAIEQALIPNRFHAPYRICVVRSQSSEEAELYHASIRAPLPTIRIPLRSTDEDVLLPLQNLLNTAYENGRYGNDIDYSQPPEPPLEEQDAVWVANYIANRKNG